MCQTYIGKEYPNSQFDDIGHELTRKVRDIEP